MKYKISMTKMPISMTFNRIFPDLQDFQAWNQQVQISQNFQIFKASYEPCLNNLASFLSGCQHFTSHIATCKPFAVPWKISVEP
jgi:hypothetical protein